MSYHRGASIELRRVHWLAIEFVFYLLALLMLGHNSRVCWSLFSARTPHSVERQVGTPKGGAGSEDLRSPQPPRHLLAEPTGCNLRAQRKARPNRLIDLEASPGIEPGCKDLQPVFSGLRNLLILTIKPSLS
jgi:hypothetical protein